jgi:hypothetical protein
VTKRLPSAVVERAVSGSTLEWKLTDVNAFGLVTASPLQRAVCRIADGRPLDELALHPKVISAVGNVDALPTEKPLEVFLLSGIRTAKSLTAACGAFHMAMTCDVSRLGPGEIPRVSVVSLKKDLADVIMQHLVGRLKASPLLSRFLIGEPTGESVMLRHPSGKPIEVAVVAGSRAGAGLVARWSAGCIFDEFPRMVGGDDGVVNWDDMRQAVLLRLLDGCQLWHIGSPWAPYGPAYEVVTEWHGKPSAERVVIRAPAPDMNPVTWTPEKIAAAKKDPDAYRTDVLAEFASPEEALFSSESVDRCTRKAPAVVGPKLGNTYYAAMDPATRGNGWTLCIATRERTPTGPKTIVVRACEWVGSREQPLDPGDVLGEIAGILAAYGLTTIDTDQAMGDALVKIGRDVGLTLRPCTLNQQSRARRYLAIRTRLDSGEIELPPVAKLRTDLLHLRKRVTPGGMAIDLPMTSDGRHCDYAPALMLVLSRLLPEAEPKAEVRKRGEDPETRRLRELMLARIRGQKDEW